MNSCHSIVCSNANAFTAVHFVFWSEDETNTGTTTEANEPIEVDDITRRQ
jgi:hypothetical protein